VTVLDFVLNSPTLVTLDAPGRIVLDADSGSVALHNGGVQYGALVDSSSNLVVRSGTTNAVKFSGADATFQGTVRSATALTTTQQDFAAAINELKLRIDLVDSGSGLVLDSAFNTIGTLSSLVTPVKTSVVNAINSMYDSAGVANTIRSVARLALSNGTGLAYSNGQFSVANNGISATQLNTDAVTTVKILDDNVTYTKIQNVATANRVLGSKTSNGLITELQVDSDILGDNSVIAAKIRDRAVTNTKIATAAITDSALAANAISTTKIQNNAVTLAKLANSITAKRVIASTTAGTFYSEQQVDSDMLGSLSIANRHIQNNAVTLGTQTTGNYVASVSSANGIKIVGTAGEGWTPTVSLDSAATGTITNLNVIGNLDVAGLTTLDSATIDGNLIVTGNLTISGTTTTVNTETITVNDNIIVLNNNAPDTPTENAGVEVERGLSTNVQLIWNETTDRWTFTNNGTTYHNIPTTDEYIDSATSKFPTTYAWTGGTTSGPTGSLTGNNLTAISFPAIPSAGAAASGIVTTDAQTFAGVKTFSSTISGSITGNAGTATTLATGRNFSLTGPITAPAISFNGSGVVALATSITAGAVDSAALGALSVSSAKLQANIPDSKLATISTAGKVANSATTATSLNTANAIVARDASGNFVAGTITGSITGNAGTATTLATSRNFSITGAVTAPAVSFNGSGAVALNTSITAGAVDSAALGSNSVTAAKIAANAVGFSQMADSAVGSNELRQAVQLIIYNSAGTELKSMYGAGE
jgi:cytoskeletal protein CcmA (bactofilin family)